MSESLHPSLHGGSAFLGRLKLIEKEHGCRVAMKK